MAKPKHVTILKQGVEVWNNWRKKEPRVTPDFRGVDLNEIISDLQGVDFYKANLSRANLKRANLSGADLRKANLSKADLSEANLTWANLSQADLSEADLSEANLSGADLSKTNLSKADLSEAGLIGANLSQADLSEAGLIGANLSQADLSEADLSGVDLQEADLIRANLFGTNLSGANLSGVDLQEADLSRANLFGTNFSEANLSGADLRKTNLSKADLSGANLCETLLRTANLIGANLSGVNLRKSDLSEMNLSEIDFSRAELFGANLSKADLSGANLSKANLREAHITEAYLSKANLYMADLQGADFRKTDLSGANLSGANLCGANLYGAILCGSETSSIANITKANLIGIKFTPEGKPVDGASFLDLSMCLGLESAKFSKQEFLQNYLAKAFEYAHKTDTYEAKKWPNFVEEAIKNIRALRTLYADREPPEQLIEVVHTITTELIKYLQKHPEAMYSLKPRQFEELIAEILASYKWDVQLTPPIKDGGYDIFAISKNIKPGVNSSWIIECKKYRPENKVGVDIVRALYGVKSDLRIANALLATTSYFTKGAKDFKASRYDIDLKDYRDVLEWINQYCPNPNGKLYIKDNRLILPNEK